MPFVLTSLHISIESRFSGNYVTPIVGCQFHPRSRDHAATTPSRIPSAAAHNASRAEWRRALPSGEASAKVRRAGPAPPALRAGLEPPAATRALGTEASSFATTPSAHPARSARGVTHFGAEVGLPSGGPRPPLGENSAERPAAGTTAGEVPPTAGLADRFGADRDVVAAADSSTRRGFLAAAATRSAVSRPAASAERSWLAASDFLRFRRGGRLGS